MAIRYPNITGTNSSEQIQQIRAWLFQLTDILNNQQPTDYIVGSSKLVNDGVEWTIRTWISGRVECYGKETKTLAINSGETSITLPVKKLPITFKQIPTCFINAQPKKAGNGNARVEYGGTCTTTETPPIKMVNTGATSSASLEYEINYLVIGG